MQAGCQTWEPVSPEPAWRLPSIPRDNRRDGGGALAEREESVGQRGQARVGTSGWIYRHWRGVFYPPELHAAKWFGFYSRFFDTVEINNTFYRLPAASVFAAWGRQATPGFVYAVKASRYLTHLKKLKDPAEALAN